MDRDYSAPRHQTHRQYLSGYPRWSGNGMPPENDTKAAPNKEPPVHTLRPHQIILQRVPRRPVLLRTDPAASATTPGKKAQRRSEERRVGKEGVSTCRSGWSQYHKKKQRVTRQHNQKQKN